MGTGTWGIAAVIPKYLSLRPQPLLLPILHNPVSCGADGFLGDAHDAADVAVFQAHLVEDEEDCEATLYTFRLEKVLWAVLGAYFFWMRQKEGKSMAL